MKKRLLLISPLGKKGLMGSDFYFRLPYLGLLKVAALTPPDDWEVSIIDEKVEPLDLDQHADLVGITAMTPTATPVTATPRQELCAARGGAPGRAIENRAIPTRADIKLLVTENRWCRSS